MTRRPIMGLAGGACFLALSLAVFVVSPGGTVAQAYSYHPLDIGSQWYYAAEDGGWELMTMTGYEEVLGTETRVRHQEDDDQTFENFWTRDDDGNLYLHGARNLTFAFEVAYLPPIRIVDVPLYEGKAWVTEHVGTYDFEGNPLGYWFDAERAVYSEGIVDVPAGTFYAYDVGWGYESPLMRNAVGFYFDIHGRCVGLPGGAGNDATESFVDGVGLARHAKNPYGGAWLELVSWQVPVPVAVTSWGAIKTLFRDAPK